MNKLLSLAEWLIAFVLIVGGISLFFAEPVSTTGPIVSLLGSHAAGIVYGIIFVTVGSTLAFAKYKNYVKLLKWSLMTAYLLSIFVVILEVLLLGWTWFILDEIVLGTLAAAAWLKLKMDTEYISQDELFDE